MLLLIKQNQISENILTQKKENLFSMGKELWEKKAKKHKIRISDEGLSRIVHKLKYKDTGHFYYSISKDENKIAEIVDILTDKTKLQSS